MDKHTEELVLEIGDSSPQLHPCERGLDPDTPLHKVQGHLLSLADVERERLSSWHLVDKDVDLLSVEGLIIVGDEAQDGGVVCEL